MSGVFMRKCGRRLEIGIGRAGRADEITAARIPFENMADRLIYDASADIAEAGRLLEKRGAITDRADVCKMFTAGEKMSLLRAVFEEER